MGIAASPFLNPTADRPNGVVPKLTTEALARRARQRRQIQRSIGVSYVIDAVILLVYAHAGTTPAIIGPAFAACGLVSVTGYILLSEAGFTERFKDHYFVVPQSIISMIIMLAFTYIAPEVGVMFLCTLFVVFAFSSLRSTPWQTGVVWTAMALGLAGLFLLTDKPISLPHETYLERFATMTVRLLERLRSIIAGLDWSAFSSGMRVTVSAGIAALKASETADTLLARADGALYKAKAQGRNRIAFA
jgi:diguanylate cyclase